MNNRIDMIKFFSNDEEYKKKKKGLRQLYLYKP